MELQEKIKACKTMAELDAMRMPIVLALKNATRTECIDTQSVFRKQKNKIRRHGGSLNNSAIVSDSKQEEE